MGAASTCGTAQTTILPLRRDRIDALIAQHAAVTDKVRANIVSDDEKPQFESARSTLALNSQPAAAPDPMQADEERMRRALGLYGDQPRPRPAPERNDPPVPRPAERFAGVGHHKRRFVHDGEVPVTLVHGLISNRREHADGNGARGTNGHAQPTNRLEVAEAALAAEIATRERTERALQESQAALHDVQTKLGHADLARQEAVEALRREREAAAELRAALYQAEARATESEQARIIAEQALAALQDRVADSAGALVVADQPPRRRRGRPPRVRPVIESVWRDEPNGDIEVIDVVALPPLLRRRGRKPRALVAAEQALALGAIGLAEFAEPPAPEEQAALAVPAEQTEELAPAAQAERAVSAEQAGIAVPAGDDVVAGPVEAPARRGRKTQPDTLPAPASAPARTRARSASRGAASAEPAAPRRRGRKPGTQIAAKAAVAKSAAAKPAIAKSAIAKPAAAKPAKAAARGRPKKAASLDPKPIRWWVNPRGKKKR